jgi:hypothetical protein
VIFGELGGVPRGLVEEGGQFVLLQVFWACVNVSVRGWVGGFVEAIGRSTPKHVKGDCDLRGVGA